MIASGVSPTILAAAIAAAISARVLAAPGPDGFDPNPMPDDLVLPMPNGARMVFRPVYLGIGEELLATRPLRIGDRTGVHYKEKVRAVHLGGQFIGDKAGQKDWLFYLGKYEVTRAQYRAINGATTIGEDAGLPLRLPQTNLTRRKMDEFIESYNVWLSKHARGALPSKTGSRGWLRLPTEEEWEFAARGGVAATDASFEAITPYSGDLARYEWLAGPRSSHGKLKEVGLLGPNPLGIFDLLGNASEMVGPLYQLDGHTGGYTIRGGSFRTDAADVRASLRIEQPQFGRDGEPSRDEAIGFRLVIASQVITDENRSQLEAASRSKSAPAPEGEAVGTLPRAAQTESQPQTSQHVMRQQGGVPTVQPVSPQDQIGVGVPPPPPAPDAPTKERPFQNNLGMRFVPVPGTNVLFSIWETRVQEYMQFVQATGHPWNRPTFEYGPAHPAANVTWHDAKAFCAWLTEKARREEGMPLNLEYRLPKDAEWSIAVGLEKEAESLPEQNDGTIKGVYPWGKQWPPPKNCGNYAPSLKTDSFRRLAPVGSFAANQFGLYDMGGNVSEWCEDVLRYDTGYEGRPLRGADWGAGRSYPDALLSSFRWPGNPGEVNDGYGFRCVLAQIPAVPPSSVPEGQEVPHPGASQVPPTLVAPDDLLSLANNAMEEVERGNYQEAEKAYEKILAKAPDNPYALSSLGVARFRGNKLKLAEEALRKAIAIAPEDAFSHSTLGIVYYSQCKYDEAVNALTKALAINPKNATAHNYLGITASQKGWQETALKELEMAITLDPNYSDAYFNLAVVFSTQQPPNKEKAHQYYKRAIELGAQSNAAVEQLIY